MELSIALIIWSKSISFSFVLSKISHTTAPANFHLAIVENISRLKSNHLPAYSPLLMPLSRLITLIVGLVLVLGLMLWLVDSLSALLAIPTILPAGQSATVVADCAAGGFDRRGCLLSADGSGCGEAIAAAAAAATAKSAAKTKRQKKRCNAATDGADSG